MSRRARQIARCLAMRPRHSADAPTYRTRRTSLVRWIAARVALALASALTVACQMASDPSHGDASRPVALVGGTVKASPDAPPIADGVVVVEGGTIAAVGPSRAVRVPAAATVLDCAGTTVSAAFWNSHVHFVESKWQSAGAAPADRLARDLEAMTTSYGFVRVLDTGSWLANTLALRERVERGEVPGPHIMTTGTGFVPAGGSPFYVRPFQLPELTDAAGAGAAIDLELDGGADALKLFTGSFAEPRRIVVMPVEIVRAAVAAAHRRRKLVVAHPSNSAGARAAVDGGVDLLAHTFPGDPGQAWDRSIPPLMSERGMGLIPTLKLWPFELRRFGAPEIGERLLATAQAQLGAFAGAGGQVLFGTDVGYMTDYDPTDEYVFMQGAGLSYGQILASLTTAPAARFRAAARAGRLAPGMDADIAVVEGDPARDIRALARVRYTLRLGRVIYQKPRTP
jgi:imidazolonepropionase-like amidohydrolase